MQTIKINSVQTGMRLVAFWVDDEFPAGEYRLVPVGEADANDAQVAKLETKLKNADTYGKAMADDNRGLRERIAELEKQLAERSPGVMPECVRDFIDHVLRRDNKRLPLGPVTFEMRKAVEAYFSPPEGHEWQPVDAEHPITSADVGRRVCRLNETVSVFGPSSGWSTTSEVYILRPIAAKFVFDGTPGRYLTNCGITCEVARLGSHFVVSISGEVPIPLNADGTFAGGRITGRSE